MHAYYGAILIIDAWSAVVLPEALPAFPYGSKAELYWSNYTAARGRKISFQGQNSFIYDPKYLDSNKYIRFKEVLTIRKLDEALKQDPK